ncbi:hypothetical protein BJX65DRAFT_293696 [Aspergillus insuetus]
MEPTPHLNLSSFPTNLPPSFLTKYTPLSRLQAGHLRHIHNLATQRPGIWGVMGTQDPGQEWVDAYRYQLATMAYAAGAAHYHRLPAMRSLFKTLLEDLIDKMLKRDVWGYWLLTSHSGKAVDPDLKELRKPWADPIVRENIMYSGHLLLMVSLYTMLFNDEAYDEDGALKFVWDPVFWGMGREVFSYSRLSLQETVLSEMESQGWLGACCEPNTIFVVCNQFPIIAFRYNDIHDKTKNAEKVILKYNEAWGAKGSYHHDGMIVDWYTVRQDSIKASGGIGSTAWTATYMNAWNPEVAQQTFRTQTTGFLTRVEKDRVNLNPAPIAHAIRKLVKEENANSHDPATIAAATVAVRQKFPSGLPKAPYPGPTFGYVSMWTSEVGDADTLDGLLNHADRYIGPMWKDGGLYYAANDENDIDTEGNWRMMDPFTGNAAIAYARLNVHDGQRKMWVEPWTPEQVDRAPFVGGLDLGSGIDVLRGAWDEQRGAMILTVRTWEGAATQVRPTFHNLPAGDYGFYHDGNLIDSKTIKRAGDVIELDLEVTADELTVVLLANKYISSSRL